MIGQSFSSEREGQDFKRKLEARTVLDGAPPDVLVTDDDALTLARWWARWEPGRQWRESSRRTHESHWSRYIKPVFGRVAIDAITTADVKRFHRKLEAKGLAPATVGAVHRTLSMCLQGAVEDQLIERNPARTAKLRRPPKHAPVALDPATLMLVLDAVEETTPKLAMYARLVAATGLRRAEAIGLTWDRIDLDNGVITVDRQLDYTASSQPTWCATKNSLRRQVLLTDATVAQLRAHRASQTVTLIGGRGLVFTRDDGSAWPRTTLAERGTARSRSSPRTDINFRAVRAAGTS
jgi:integrase